MKSSSSTPGQGKEGKKGVGGEEEVTAGHSCSSRDRARKGERRGGGLGRRTMLQLGKICA